MYFPSEWEKLKNAERQIFNLTTNRLPPPWQKNQCVLLAGGICAPEAAKRQQRLICYCGPIWSSHKNPIWRPDFSVLHTNKSPAAPNSPRFPPSSFTLASRARQRCASTSTQLTSEGKFLFLLKLTESSGFSLTPQDVLILIVQLIFN